MASRKRHRQHQQRQQRPELLAAQPLAGLGAVLRAGDAARHQQEGEHDVDRLVGGGMDQRGVGGDEDDLEQRGADDDVGRHFQEIDQRRHHDEAAADAHDRRQEADAGAEAEHRDDADEQLRGPEPHLQRQPVDPVVLAGLLQRRCRAAARGAAAH